MLPPSLICEGQPVMSSHTVTKSIVRGAGGSSVFRAACSCGDFKVDAARLSTPARRRQDRMVLEHLTSAAGDNDARGALEVAALLVNGAIEAPL
jgi:hypothetical protein